MRTNIAIDGLLHKRFQRAAVLRRKTLRQAADEAVAKWIGDPKKLAEADKRYTDQIFADAVFQIHSATLPHANTTTQEA
jgi:hypothetical protein